MEVGAWEVVGIYVGSEEKFGGLSMSLFGISILTVVCCLIRIKVGLVNLKERVVRLHGFKMMILT